MQGVEFGCVTAGREAGSLLALEEYLDASMLVRLYLR